MKRGIVAIAIAVVLTGCGDPHESVVGEATPDPMHAPIDHRCEEPAAEILDLVRGELDVRAELEHARLVASEEDDDLLFVAARLVGEALDEEAPIATWVIIEDGTGHDVYAVSAPARYHSSSLDGTRRNDPITMATDGAEEAETCVAAATE